MANTKSAKKAARQTARRTIANKARRSRMRSYARKVEEAIASGDKDAAAAALREAEPMLARTAQKGLLHRKPPRARCRGLPGASAPWARLEPKKSTTVAVRRQIGQLACVPGKARVNSVKIFQTFDFGRGTDRSREPLPPEKFPAL